MWMELQFLMELMVLVEVSKYMCPWINMTMVCPVITINL